MINQPDTSTMEGRHAIERASRKFRIERNSTRLYSENWIGWTSSTGVFNWVDFSYRIHPDDLAAWAETQKRDVWTLSKDGDLFRNGEVRGCGIPYYANVQELIDALNGAPDAKEAQHQLSELILAVINAELLHAEKLYAEKEVTGDRLSRASTRGSYIAIKNLRRIIKELVDKAVSGSDAGIPAETVIASSGDLKIEPAGVKVTPGWQTATDPSYPDKDAETEAAKAAVTIARQEIAEQRVLIEQLSRLHADKDRYIAGRNRLIVVLNAKLDEVASRKPVTASDWEPKKSPATVTPGPIEDYREWTCEDVQAGTVLMWHKDKGTVLVTYAGPADISIEAQRFDYDDLLHSGWRQLNGDRCGVRKEA
jgi:hypothetical protein